MCKRCNTAYCEPRKSLCQSCAAPSIRYCKTCKTKPAQPRKGFCQTCQPVRFVRCCTSCGVMLITGNSTFCTVCREHPPPPPRIANPDKEYYRNMFSMRRKLRRYRYPFQACIHGMKGRIGAIIKHRLPKTKELFGCMPEEFRTHLESQWKPGMSWENYGEWHVDHVIPMCRARNTIEVLSLSHYTNLQPLWARENLKKGSK